MRQPDWETEDGSIRLFYGDCLDILPELEAGSVDAVVTSPPYNKIPKTSPSGIFAEHSHKLNHGYASHGDDMPQNEYELWVSSVVSECMKVCRGTSWVNSSPRFVNRIASHPLRYINAPLFCEVIWDRGGSLTLNAGRFAPSHEHIFGFGVPVCWNQAETTRMTVWRVTPERDVDGHPCPFPVEIPTRCVAASTMATSCVCDPFMGSGTTGVACVRLGRRFIGIEKERKYFDIAVDRITKELKRLELFEPAPKIVQRNFLGE